MIQEILYWFCYLAVLVWRRLTGYVILQPWDFSLVLQEYRKIKAMMDELKDEKGIEQVWYSDITNEIKQDLYIYIVFKS